MRTDNNYYVILTPLRKCKRLSGAPIDVAGDDDDDHTTVHAYGYCSSVFSISNEMTLAMPKTIRSISSSIRRVCLEDPVIQDKTTREGRYRKNSQ